MAAMTARDDILGGIRRALRRGPLPADAASAVAERVAAHRRNLVPARAAALDHAGRVDLFVRMAEEVQTTVARVTSEAEVPGEVARYLAAENLPAELVMAPDPALAAMPWEARPLLQIRRGRAGPGDAVSLTPCFAAVAETGTPERALELVDSLELGDYRYLHSTRAEMLRRLSGRSHVVMTGVSVRWRGDIASGVEEVGVSFRPLSDAEIERYIDTGEPMRYTGISKESRDAWVKIAAAVAEGL